MRLTAYTPYVLAACFADESTNTCVVFQVENVRRKHNYLPFIMELLKVLAKKGDLVPLVEKVRINSYSFHSLLSLVL